LQHSRADERAIRWKASWTPIWTVRTSQPSAIGPTDYRKIARKIVAEFGDMPLSLLADKRTRGEFLQWRDNLAKHSRRQADYAWTVLALILSWAKGRGTIDVNPCERG
jgi:hypothetical protein